MKTLKEKSGQDNGPQQGALASPNGGGPLLAIAAKVVNEAKVTKETALGRVVGLAEDSGTPTILIADDVALNRQVLRELLEDVGFECEEAGDGQEAAMEAIRRLEEGTKSETPLVALTGSVFDGDRHKAAEAGATAFLMKPIEEDRIWQVLEGALELKFVREEVGEVEPESVPITSTELEVLGADTRAELLDSVQSADLTRASELLEPFQKAHPEVVAQLQSLLDGYDYDGLLDLLGSVEA